MYKGRFVEIGTRQDIYTNPQHIYTKRLLSAIPKIDVANREAHKEERRRVEQEYRENHKDYYDENGRVYNLHAISPTHQVALKMEVLNNVENNFTPFVIDDSASDYFKCLDFPVG